MEQRRRQRANVEWVASVLSDARNFESCICESLSLSGAYIKCETPLDIGSSCHLNLKLTGTQVAISIEAKVARKDDNGMGLSFEQMDPESLIHLKNLIKYQIDDPDSFLDECERRPGFK